MGNHFITRRRVVSGLFLAGLILAALMPGTACSPAPDTPPARAAKPPERPTNIDPRHQVTVNPKQVPVIQSEGQREFVPITGEASYPTPLVLYNLGLGRLVADAGDDGFQVDFAWRPAATPPDYPVADLLAVSAASLADQPILSLGEGYSGLVPFLRRLDIRAYGLDLWYDPAVPLPDNAVGRRFMDEYRRRHQDILITGDATDLRRVRSRDFQTLADDTFAMVVSHILFEYLERADQVRMLREALRVTRPGGTVRIASTRQYQPADFQGYVTDLQSAGLAFDAVFLRLDTTVGTTLEQETAGTIPRYSLPPEDFRKMLQLGGPAPPPPLKNNLEIYLDLFVLIKR
ncbi:MAG: class I SAM-dependent methyltransferase [Acidobacteria bacterium]|nr:class I SAM-dependent methyltransferase [Acidobacteriota bacterium]